MGMNIKIGQRKFQGMVIYTATCPFCGRNFKSLYRNQIKNWIGNHLQTHEEGDGEND